jgi:hypothetical protein
MFEIQERQIFIQRGLVKLPGLIFEGVKVVVLGEVLNPKPGGFQEASRRLHQALMHDMFFFLEFTDEL